MLDSAQYIGYGMRVMTHKTKEEKKMKKLVLIVLTVASINSYADSAQDYYDRFQAQHRICTTSCNAYNCTTQCG